MNCVTLSRGEILTVLFMVFMVFCQHTMQGLDKTQYIAPRISSA